MDDVTRVRSTAARLLIGLALGKLVFAAVAVTAALATGGLTPSTIGPVTTAVIAVTYAAVGAALGLGGFADSRCRALGIFLLLVATSFADALSVRAHPLGGATRVMLAVHLDVFLPAFLWWFVRDFPSRAVPPRAYRWLDRAAVASLATGVLLAAINLAVDVRPVDGPAVTTWFDRLARSQRGDGLYWPLLFGLMVPAAPAMAFRAFRAAATDRRQVRLFVLAMLAGLLPISIDVALRAASPAWREWLTQPSAAFVVQAAVVAAFLSVPFTTAYAVLVVRVADLRLILRAALQYALARYTVIVLLTLPAVWLAGFIYTNRLQSLQQLMSSRGALALVLGGAAAAVALSMRQRALDHLDRRFFREQYDTERVLQGVMSVTRSQASGEHVADQLAAEVDQALHVDRLAVMLRHDASSMFVARDGRVRPLPVASTLVLLLSASDDPLDADPEDPQSVLRRLSADEVHWLVDGGFRMLVPMRGPDGVARGILALGEKRSELPYSIADRHLLAAVGASGGLSLARRDSARAPVPAPVAASAEDEQPAQECLTCGLVCAGGAASCSCGGALVVAPVPRTLAGKFRLRSRLGAGGMGVVYRADDLTLGRTVAVKTLPVSGPAETWRLRREARAMALVSHEHLALIYGAESWQGHPFLVVEFLAGGTLSDRLRRERLPVVQMLRLGIVLASVLDTLHGAGLLHRDLKPSNIGFTADGKAKLLDFGLAQLVAPGSADSTRGRVATTRPDPLGQRTQHGFGTPAYMSPEALANAAPAASFDLWSLAVLLVEAVSGTNPFAGKTSLETIQRITRHSADHVANMLPGCDPGVVGFFVEALNPDIARRPPTAAEFERRLNLLSRLPEAG